MHVCHTYQEMEKLSQAAQVAAKTQAELKTIELKEEAPKFSQLLHKSN